MKPVMIRCSLAALLVATLGCEGKVTPPTISFFIGASDTPLSASTAPTGLSAGAPMRIAVTSAAKAAVAVAVEVETACGCFSSTFEAKGDETTTWHAFSAPPGADCMLQLRGTAGETTTSLQFLGTADACMSPDCKVEGLIGLKPCTPAEASDADESDATGDTGQAAGDTGAQDVVDTVDVGDPG